MLCLRRSSPCPQLQAAVSESCDDDTTAWATPDGTVMRRGLAGGLIRCRDSTTMVRTQIIGAAASGVLSDKGICDGHVVSWTAHQISRQSVSLERSAASRISWRRPIFTRDYDAGNEAEKQMVSAADERLLFAYARRRRARRKGLPISHPRD